jgi:hypothetical protein
MPAKHTDAGSRSVALLDPAPVQQMASEVTRMAKGHPAKVNWDHHLTPTISVIDRASPRTVTVFWCDPLSGSYENQSWRLSLAMQPGPCLLSGQAVKRGELIYCPWLVQRPPGNAGAMVVASCVDNVLCTCPPT